VPPLKVANFDWLPRFQRAFKKLDEQVQQDVKDTLKKLKENPDLPGLNVEKLSTKKKGKKHAYSVRVNQNFRISFALDGTTVVLRNVGTHNKVYTNP
jgi:mRNA-degrading endonuclease RelE of RelBE toxin-antitoxin system